jgi:hypothetical protein
MKPIGKNARKRLVRKEQSVWKNMEWDSETDSDDYSSEDGSDGDLCDWELDIINEYGRPAFEKYKIMTQYNIGELTEPFLEATNRMHKKHLNLKNFSPVSGIQNKKEKEQVMEAIIIKLVAESHERIYYMDLMDDAYTCIRAVNLLRCIGCVDFLSCLPIKRLPNDIETRLQQFFKTSTDHVSDASALLYHTFGIKIKSSNNDLYLKSPWIWDKKHNRILPILDGTDTRLLPLKK